MPLDATSSEEGARETQFALSDASPGNETELGGVPEFILLLAPRFQEDYRVSNLPKMKAHS